MLQIDLQTARRYILGRQGLWPGRRWRGPEGTQQALRAMEYLQLDPLQVIARSQDITLHSRVLDYPPELWEQLAYQQRRFFDWGGWLALRPMDELPYWRVVMQRERESVPRLLKIANEHPQAIDEMRARLQAGERLSNRDFKASARTGEAMTHHRENFERVYARTEDVAPEELLYERGEDETDRFLVLKEIQFSGLSRLQRTSDAFRRGVPFERKQQLLEALLAAGEIVEVQVEGWKFVHYALAREAGLIEMLAAGGVPEAWAPVGADTTAEAVFLSPLDPVCARGRAKELFGFDYVWEVYKPEPQRQYGYYALPILWGERLVGRFDSKLDRTSNTFIILGLWLEDPALGDQADFAAALARGFARFKTFLGAQGLQAGAVAEPRLRRSIANGT